MSSLEFRLANLDDASDAEAIASIVNAYAMEPQGGGKSLPDDVLQRMAPGLKQVAGSFVMLAVLDGKPVGAAVCFRGFSTFAGRPLINVHDLSVLKEFRGKGIGTQLLAAVEEYAIAQGCGKVTLEVREANPLAERLYRRLGYGDPSGFPTRFLDKPLTGPASPKE